LQVGGVRGRLRRILEADTTRELNAAGAGERARDPYLDLLRAIAIVMVVVYHVVLNSPEPVPRLAAVTQFGRYGVDLFFVLSGWLIGGLYWRELRRFGNVELRSFLPRRWIRTVPPYFAGLALAWLARPEIWSRRIDLTYFCFLQNYRAVISLFQVSWSLCIEEHFYFFLPLLVWFFGRMRIAAHWLFAGLLIVAPVCRWLASRHGLAEEFGYVYTATHLRMEGLILGFWAAYIPAMAKERWPAMKRWCGWLLVPALLALTVLPFLSEMMMYRVGLTVMALALMVILVFLAERRTVWIAQSGAIKWVALTSYSVYLTHAVILHFATGMMKRADFLPDAAFFPLALVLVGVGGWVFYWGVERTSLQVRDRWFPRRTERGTI